MPNKIVDETFKIDFSINHSITTSWTMNEYHFHQLFEIYFSLSDNIKCFINGGLYTVERGDLFLFRPTDFHKIVVPSNTHYERYYILFNPQYIESLSTESTDLLKCFRSDHKNIISKVHLDGDSYTTLISLLNKANARCSSSCFGSDVYKKMALAEILLFLNPFYEHAQKPAVLKSERDHDKILPVINYIDHHLGESLTLDRLSNKFFVSKYYMECLFKKATGFSINEYIINKRILKSRELLKKNLPVSQVAEMVGFNSDSHFIRTFKKLVTVSPKQYAKRVE